MTSEHPMADLNRRLIEEANLLDAAHRWTMASINCAVDVAVFSLAALFTWNENWFIGAAAAVGVGAVVHLRASVLIGKARVLRELREGRLH